MFNPVKGGVPLSLHLFSKLHTPNPFGHIWTTIKSEESETLTIFITERVLLLVIQAKLYEAFNG